LTGKSGKSGKSSPANTVGQGKSGDPERTSWFRVSFYSIFHLLKVPAKSLTIKNTLDTSAELTTVGKPRPNAARQRSASLHTIMAAGEDVKYVVSAGIEISQNLCRDLLIVINY
jgi:hypothetical protein